MYERLYRSVKREADSILQGNKESSAEWSEAKSQQRKGLASRMISGMERSMQEVTQSMLDDPRRNPDVLKKRISEYLASIDTNYAVEDEPAEAEKEKETPAPAAAAPARRGVAAPPARPSSAAATASTTTEAGSDIGRRLMRDLMRDYGLNKEYAAGIVGNLDYESGGFQHMQEIEPLVKGSRGGWGYAQWTGPRRVAFEKFAEENGLDPASYEANYGFLKHELGMTKEGDFLDEHEYIYDPEEAARVFADYYLRPSKRHANMEERIKRARAYATMKDV